MVRRLAASGYEYEVTRPCEDDPNTTENESDSNCGFTGEDSQASHNTCYSQMMPSLSSSTGQYLWEIPKRLAGRELSNQRRVDEHAAWTKHGTSSGNQCVTVGNLCLKQNGFGAPGRTRTHNLLVRSQALYPIELQGHYGMPSIISFTSLAQAST